MCDLSCCRFFHLNPGWPGAVYKTVLCCRQLTIGQDNCVGTCVSRDAAAHVSHGHEFGGSGNPVPPFAGGVVAAWRVVLAEGTNTAAGMTGAGRPGGGGGVRIGSKIAEAWAAKPLG